MFYVYLIRSEMFPDQTYIGFIEHVPNRLGVHNNGGSVHTAKYKPWILVASFGFQEKTIAQAFEKYLKTVSGRAFSIYSLTSCCLYQSWA